MTVKSRRDRSPSRRVAEGHLGLAGVGVVRVAAVRRHLDDDVGPPRANRRAPIVPNSRPMSQCASPHAREERLGLVRGGRRREVQVGADPPEERVAHRAADERELVAGVGEQPTELDGIGRHRSGERRPTRAALQGGERGVARERACGWHGTTSVPDAVVTVATWRASIPQPRQGPVPTPPGGHALHVESSSPRPPRRTRPRRSRSSRRPPRVGSSSRASCRRPHAAVIARRNRAGRLEWCLPKGHLEGAETPEEAAVREIAEETGIQGEILQALGTIDYWFTGEDRRVHKVVHHFLLECDGRRAERRRRPGRRGRGRRVGGDRGPGRAPGLPERASPRRCRSRGGRRLRMSTEPDRIRGRGARRPAGRGPRAARGRALAPGAATPPGAPVSTPPPRGRGRRGRRAEPEPLPNRAHPPGDRPVAGISPRVARPGQDLRVRVEVTQHRDADDHHATASSCTWTGRRSSAGRRSTPGATRGSTAPSARRCSSTTSRPRYRPASPHPSCSPCPPPPSGCRAAASSWGARGLAVQVVDAADPARVRLGLARTFALWFPEQEVTATRLSVVAPVTGVGVDPHSGAWVGTLEQLTRPGGRLGELLEATGDHAGVTWVVDPWFTERRRPRPAHHAVVGGGSARPDDRPRGLPAALPATRTWRRSRTPAPPGFSRRLSRGPRTSQRRQVCPTAPRSPSRGRRTAFPTSPQPR